MINIFRVYESFYIAHACIEMQWLKRVVVKEIQDYIILYANVQYVYAQKCFVLFTQ